MVRFAGETPRMENREELLDALNDFMRKQPKEIPPLLEQFLKQVAKTGETLFPWTLLKALFIAKLEQVLAEFSEEYAGDQPQSYPNVENARFDVYKTRIMEAVHRFHGAPFTIQRLCELLTDPRRHYKRCDKFMRGLEKNVLVVSTVDPFGKKVVSESKNLVNGTDSNNSNDEALPADSNLAEAATVAPPGVAAVWPANADLITPSSAPLLEVSDLPDPKELAAVASSTTVTTTTTTNPSSSEESSGASSQAMTVNGQDISAVSSVEVATFTGHSEEVVTDSSAADPSSHPADSSDASSSSSSLSLVTGATETVDSSDQQVAAEEMVGVEEETAESTTVSQPEAEMEAGGEGSAQEGLRVVEAPPAITEVTAEVTESEQDSGEATPVAASGDNIVQEPAEDSESKDISGDSSSDATPDTSSSSTSQPCSSQPPADTCATGKEAEAMAEDKDDGQTESADTQDAVSDQGDGNSSAVDAPSTTTSSASEESSASSPSSSSQPPSDASQAAATTSSDDSSTITTTSTTTAEGMEPSSSLPESSDTSSTTTDAATTPSSSAMVDTTSDLVATASASDGEKVEECSAEVTATAESVEVNGSSGGEEVQGKGSEGEASSSSSKSGDNQPDSEAAPAPDPSEPEPMEQD